MILFVWIGRENGFVSHFGSRRRRRRNWGPAAGLGSTGNLPAQRCATLVPWRGGWDGEKRGCSGETHRGIPSHPRDSTGSGSSLKFGGAKRSEEHTSELQSLRHLVC